jgi:ABC-2 type transport system permease protein
MNINIAEHLRIIWAIASKDIRDSIKNKIVLGILIGVGFLMLSSQAMPIIMKVNAEPRAFFYDLGKSTALREIVRSREIQFFPVDTFQEMVNSVGSSSIPVLGLIIPSDFDLAVNNGSTILLDGYSIHWARPSEIDDLITHFQDTLSGMTGQTIEIQLVNDSVYPNPAEPGFTDMIVTGLVIVVMTISLILVPFLIIEEKENHTFEVLIISPAKISHLLAGKSIAGMLYGLVAATVMLIFYSRWIVHWELVILAVFLGSLASVSLGLFFGITFKNFTTINLWVGIAIVLLLIPAFLWTGIQNKLSIPIRILFQAFPSFAMSNMVGVSLLEGSSFTDIWDNTAVLIGFVIVTLSLVWWKIWKMDI